MNNFETNSKNLVLGFVKTYEFEQIKPFVISLKNSGYKGDICFMYSDLSTRTIELLQEYGVQLYHFKELYANLPFYINKKFQFKVNNKKIYPYLLLNIYPLNRLYTWLVSRASTLSKENQYLIKCQVAQYFLNVPSCNRYPLYYLYLSKYGKNYSKVMLSDVRDVIFQRDPFDFEFDDGLCCFLEEEEKTIGSSEGNMQWLREGFGNDAIAKIADKSISCSGTTIGSLSSIMLYLEAMVDAFVQLKYHSWGIDQGVHNYIIYQGLVKNVRFYKNHHGPILTMHYTNEENLRFDSNGYLINEDGSTVNVLHQYDRLRPEIRNKMAVYRESECNL